MNGRAISTTFLLWIASCLSGQTLPPRMREALQVHLKASDAQIRQVESGGVVAYAVETGSPEDIMLVGVTRIWATPSAFVQQYRDIVKFEASPGVLAAGKFSSPPTESDLKSLSLTKSELDELRSCQPAKCSFKMGKEAMTYLQSNINWKDSDYADQANRAVRALWLSYLLEYQRTGDKALARYHDTPQIFSVGEGLNSLIAKTPILSEYAPEMLRYIREYPQAKDKQAEEMFYWQVGAFGLKPVHRLTHVVIGKGPTLYGDGYLIASKMLFASHYFRSAIELRFLVPGQDQNRGGLHYLICVQRSYVDGLTGFKGKMLRGVILKKSTQSMQSYMVMVKERVEQAFNQPK